MTSLPLFVTLLALSAPALAQESAEPAPEKVEVSSVKDPELLPYRRMVRGLDAWEAKRALAPKADLRFELWNKEGKIASPEGLQLRIAGDTVDIALPLDGDATFVLPRSQDAYDDKADLVSNRKKDQIRWRARVRTPGLPPNVRRLGDLRMECEVGAAIRKEDIPLVMRAGAVAVGGICNLPMTGYTFRTPRPVSAVTLVSGERKASLAVTKGTMFNAPLRDKSWDNETLVVYTFAEAQAPDTP